MIRRKDGDSYGTAGAPLFSDGRPGGIHHRRGELSASHPAHAVPADPGSGGGAGAEAPRAGKPQGDAHRGGDAAPEARRGDRRHGGQDGGGIPGHARPPLRRCVHRQRRDRGDESGGGGVPGDPGELSRRAVASVQRQCGGCDGTPRQGAARFRHPHPAHGYHEVQLSQHPRKGPVGRHRPEESSSGCAGGGHGGGPRSLSAAVLAAGAGEPGRGECAHELVRSASERAADRRHVQSLLQCGGDGPAGRGLRGLSGRAGGHVGGESPLLPPAEPGHRVGTGCGVEEIPGLFPGGGALSGPAPGALRRRRRLPLNALFRGNGPSCAAGWLRHTAPGRRRMHRSLQSMHNY